MSAMGWGKCPGGKCSGGKMSYIRCGFALASILKENAVTEENYSLH